VAYYKRHYFGVKAERLPVEQGQLFEETLAADMAAMTEELAQLSAETQGKAKRKPLPPELPRTEIHHEPESTTCACGCQMKRIGEDVAEKLDYTPGTFTVERHIRGKWACAQCETLVQAPVPAHVIDKGHPDHGIARACADCQISGPPAAVSPGRYLRPGRFADSRNRRWPSGSVRWALPCNRWSMP
jgi:transposase